MAIVRNMPNVVVRTNVVNQSPRTAPVSLIVIHATEGHNRPGIGDLQDLADYFNDPNVKASSHVAVDAEGQSARMVPDHAKAWTCAGYNSRSLNIEQIGFSTGFAWTRPEVRETARWVALWSRRTGIPIRRALVNNAGSGTVLRSGVCAHSDLGDVGGNHDDPGTAYPWNTLMALAALYKARQIAARSPK